MAGRVLVGGSDGTVRNVKFAHKCRVAICLLEAIPPLLGVILQQNSGFVKIP